MDGKQKTLLAGGFLGGILIADKSGAIIKGVALGLITILVAMLLTYQSVNGVDETSARVAAMSLQAVEDVGSSRGMLKVYGKLATADALEFKLLRCSEAVCVNPETALEKDNLLYYDIELQRFEVIRDVQESESSGSTATETVSYRHEWVSKDSSEDWADVTIGGLKLNADKARSIISTESEEVTDVYIEGLSGLETYGRTPSEDEPAFGTTRALVTYLENDGREYTVVGELRSDGFSSGNPFILSDKSESELVAQLGGEETASRWFMRFVAFVLLTFGFTSILSPVLVLTDMIPLAGKAARNLATLVSAVIAGVVVLTTVFLLNYWWIFPLGALLLALAFAAVTFMKQRSKEAKS